VRKQYNCRGGRKTTRGVTESVESPENTNQMSLFQQLLSLVFACDFLFFYRALGFEVKKPDIIKMVHEVDPTNTGTVDYEQFLEIMVDKYAERDPEEEIKKAFGLFDEDHTGKITLKNMKRVARELGENLSEEELQAMIDEFDRDQDGEISGDEFLYIMRQSTMY